MHVIYLVCLHRWPVSCNGAIHVCICMYVCSSVFVFCRSVEYLQNACCESAANKDCDSDSDSDSEYTRV